MLNNKPALYSSSAILIVLKFLFLNTCVLAATLSDPVGQYLVYPVLSHDHFFIESSADPALEVVLYDLQVNSLGPLPAGVYVVSILSDHQVVKSLQVHKQ